MVATDTSGHPPPGEEERFKFDLAVLRAFEKVQGAATHALFCLCDASWDVAWFLHQPGWADTQQLAAELRDYHSLLVWDIKRAGRVAAQTAAFEDQGPLLRIMRAVPFGQKPGARA